MPKPEANNRTTEPPKYKPITLQNLKDMPQAAQLTKEQLFDIQVVGTVLPFRSNYYVADNLIDWDNVENDPFFTLNFCQREMLKPRHFDAVADLLKREAPKVEINALANKIRMELNPHPAGQQESNKPDLDGQKLNGMQHKYRETVLFFPSQGQTCHAYCSYCFRWAQFVGIDELKFAMKESELLVDYVRQHPEVSDVLFTGGDPMIMKTKAFASYIDPLLSANLENLQTIRIGSKALGYWPHRFLTDPDADDMIRLFEKIVKSGKHLAFMAHFNHKREMETPAVQEAIRRIRDTGAQIRTQCPILANINDTPEVWSDMWKEQVKQGCIPYYMFQVRDTGAQHYFGISLERAWRIYRQAYQDVSGVARTVRGPSMSADPGKVEVLGINEIAGKKVFTLRFLQARNPQHVGRPFFARYDPDAIWLDDLVPAFGEDDFFFEEKTNRARLGQPELELSLKEK